MGDYYNKTRNAISVSLRRGGSVMVAPKSWCFIDPKDEGTPSLFEALKKGYLSPSLISRTEAAPEASEPPVAQVAVAPAPVAPNPAPAAAKPELSSVTAVSKKESALVDATVSVATSASTILSDTTTTVSITQSEPKPTRRNK